MENKKDVTKEIQSILVRIMGKEVNVGRNDRHIACWVACDEAYVEKMDSETRDALKEYRKAFSIYIIGKHSYSKSCG